MNIVAEMTLSAICGSSVLPHYREALRHACEEVVPLFGRKAYGELYREAAADPEWMATSLITNADREGEGAGRLWDLAACTIDAGVASQIKQHGLDESVHARAYLTMLDLTFPGAVDEGLRPRLLALSLRYKAGSPPLALVGSPHAHPVTLDDLIQMNIAEIRTRIHHLLQRPMLLEHCPFPRRPHLQRILDRLLGDETRHIAYTARLIEEAAETEAAAVHDLMRQRLRDFDEVTEDELGHRAFE